MILRLVVFVCLGCLATAGPLTWDDSKCSQYCPEASKYQYSPDTSYVYSYTSENELQADRTSELITKLQAVVTITSISKCEMMLQLSNVQSDSHSLSGQLEKHPLPFSFNDGKIEHVCPNPEDPDEVNNIKKSILSSIQNTMRGFEMSSYNVDTDILGTCDTSYKAKELSHEKYEILKTINIPSCSNHLKGQTLLLASLYESSSHRQHLPFLSDEKATCKQIIDKGVIKEVDCEESAFFKPLSDYGYVVKAMGRTNLKKLSVQPATDVPAYRAPKKENLVFKFQTHSQKSPEAAKEAKDVLRHICENSGDLISKEVASYVHKLVYTIRQMDAASVESVYNGLKNNQICNKGKKALSIYLDALRMSSSGGSIALLSKLAARGEISMVESLIWLTMLPFTSYVEEESVASLIPLLRKGIANRQALLGTTSLAYKYCSMNPDCESTQAIKDLSSKLKEFLGEKCSAKNQDEETEILTALKAFGNLGFFGEKANDIFDCAMTPTNKMTLRMAAIDAFRRSPCKDEISSKLVEIYSNKNEHDELRIGALISLSKCPSKEIMKKVVEAYSSETSKQVEVFTWTLLENIRTSQDPVKSAFRQYLNFLHLTDSLKKPKSIDVTKFSRNFDMSFFSPLFNLGISKDANLIHSADSFIPRSGNMAYKLNAFGNQLETIEVGGRVEDLEHILEKIFGPVGILSNIDVEELIKQIPIHLQRSKRSADSYESKINSLSERLGYQRNKVPHGTAFVRIMGHELGLLHLNEESLKRIAGLKAGDMLKNLASLRDIDSSKNLLFTDLSVLFPSVTGRAYKLAANGSFTLGMKAQGKIDFKSNFPIPEVDIDGKFQPSILAEASASFTIHCDPYFEPGVKVETVLNAGLDYKAKLQLKDGRLMHIKLTREQQRSEILSLKRTLYYMNQKGKIEMQKPRSHSLNYCTRYLQKLTGARVCASLSFPHAFENGKFKVPFVRELEASIVVEQTDPSMDGYELLLEIPDFENAKERRFRILADTPNSALDRKFSLEYNRKMPNANSCSLTVNLHTPFYTLDANANIINRDDHFKFSTDITGDGKRRYSLNVDAAKVVKGARLIEYQPKITLSLPSMQPKEFTGTVVFSRGRKAQLSINMESRSFDSMFTIKGNMAKEGESIDLSSNWKLNYEFNINAFSQIHRFHMGIGYDVSNGMFFDGAHHFEPDGRGYESVTFNAKIDNIKIFERISFSLDTQVLFAEHQDLNTMLKWDFSFKPLHHLKNDLIFRYGENFEDDTHLVRLTFVSALHGDFNSFQKLSVENKAGITISCLDFDKSASLSAVWDFIDEPKFVIEAGIKSDKDKEIKIDFNYRHIEKNPLKLATDFVFTYNTYKFKYRDEAVEVSPKKFHWKSVIEPTEGKEITTDIMYHFKSQDDFHHELEGTIQFPGFPQPVKQKGHLQITESKVDFVSDTDFGRGSSYSVVLKLERRGTNELKLDMPFIEGNLVVDATSPVRSIQADFRSKGKDNRHIILNGKVTPGDTNTLELDVQWDADRDPEQKVSIQLSSSIENDEGVEKYMISGSINYVNSIEISGAISTDLIKGPHFFRAEFSGNMEPMAIEIEHEIKNGHMTSVTRYLRSGVEKIRADMTGKFIYREYSHFEIEGGIVTSSPYKTFDGKSVFFQIMGDSNDDLRTFVSEYRLKFSPVIGYEGKIDYQRKRGWPGAIKSNLLVNVHNRPLYEGLINVDYGTGKYSCKISFTPITKKKIHFLTSFEHASHFAAFHHSLVTNLQLLQTVDLNAVADLRNMEDAQIYSNMDVDSHKLYDANSTLKIRSIIDFDIEANILSKITPSLKMFSKAQASGQVSKFDFNLNIDSKDVITGSGEIKKRKRGFNSDIAFKYKEKEILGLIIQQDGKGKHERNYLIKLRFPARLYIATVKVNKEKKGVVNYETKFCRNEELCLSVDATHKEYDNINEWQITYKRGDVDFSIERIRESSKNVERFHTVIYKGDHRFGYDVRFGSEGPGKSLSLGVILPSREIIIKGTAEFSLSKPRIKFDLSADGRNHPNRKLSIDVKFENHFMDSDPSKIDIIIAHPTFEKPIEIKLAGDYEPTSSKYFTADGSLDYSNDPEDKLIGKMSIEDISGVTDVLLIHIYHKDEQHLDFVVKLNSTSNSNEATSMIHYNWKDENGADTEAYMIGSYQKIEKRVYFVYQRPKLQYRLDGKIKSLDSLLNNTCEVDLESVYNGKTTKGKLVSDYDTGCHKLTIINDEDEISRVVELCINLQSRKLLSLISEGLDDEGMWTVQYMSEVVQKDWNTIGFRQQINPEFLGSTLFLMTSFIDELEAAGVGTIPFYDSPRFKIIRRSFKSKVLDPFTQFVIPEAKKFSNDIVTDAIILQRALMYYYSKLPALEAVKEYIMTVRLFIRSIAKEAWTNIYSYYESYIRTILQYIDKFRELAQEKCENNIDCRTLVRSYQTGGWKGVLDELKNLLLSLPGKIQNFFENPSGEVRNYFRSLFNILKALLHPLTKYRCGEIVVKVVQLSYDFLQPRVQAFLSRVPTYYSGIKHRLTTNEYIKISVELLKKGYLMLREEIRRIDYQKIIVYLRKHMEDYLSTVSPPSKRVNVNELDVEKGILDVDIRDEITTKILRVFAMGMDGLLLVTEKSVEAGLNYNWNTILIKFKRIIDMDFIPPYDVQAVILGHQHFVTFDNVFYDFAGECSYLLTRDFQDGNFTLVLKPKEGDEPASILVLKGDISVELTSGRASVKVAENAVQLPYITKRISVTREGNTIVVNTKNGFEVKCNSVHQICAFRMSGWYYGKTAGLLGTYNYEEHDEFKRPKGQIANSINVFAKSWELKKGCKTNNLVPDANINRESDYYKICRSHFALRSSPLAACFGEVPPEDYFNLCLRYLALDRDHKALCNVAAAYVTECEKNYVELNLPSRCLKCDAPDGSKLDHGDRKKFENLNKKSVDTIFIIEDHECNKVLVRDLASFGRSIEKELQNEGFRENMFGVVGFGGDIGDPQIFTAKDKLFFNSRDLASIADTFKLESKKVNPSKAFDAINHAVTHLSRSATAKSFVLISCSACKYDYTSLQYPVVQQILLERGIGLHVIKDNEIPIRKSSSKEKNIIGVDPDTVFYTKDVTQKDLVGEPSLRSQVIMPKDLCIALSQDVNGSFFSTHPISKASSTEVKNFRSVFARKFLKSAQLFSCQWCDCTSTRDHLPNTVCQPCEIRRPRLPFSVGSTNAQTRTLEAFISYLIHVMRE